MAAVTEFRAKILSRGSKPDDYRIYRAGLEWDLTDPIVIESAEDFKSTPAWKDKLDPYQHQVNNLITFCRRLPVTLLADDVGLGKTISAGLVISELVARGRLSKILIVCPKILGQQWKDELSSKFGIPAEIAIGSELLAANPKDTGAVITTYNTARIYLDRLPEDRFEMLILDEAHKLRNLYGIPNPPQVAKKFQKALADRRFRFVLMLTATPIQNRLWDIYSLVDLLTVARGHENPFGKEGMFKRRFIADPTDGARQLKADAKEEFRSIVYGYMSRVRRDDAKLLFPKRIVQMHEVSPTPDELLLIETIAKPIQKLNRLAQISILQALVSSPDALSTQLQNSARRGTVPPTLAADVKHIVDRMAPSAKLAGLAKLVAELKRQHPDRWRLVIFTTRRETQTTIQTYLERQGFSVGIINGDSGQRNQETIDRFKAKPPKCHVIVSTEAGSEGVNLQVANVLVNYDLPWNPMIVEQRIGRVQRLASDHANVSIFNMTLKGTFEEYIVGRLMEKLQMAAHAIGDIESLLRGSDIGDSDDDAAESFEGKILNLVLAALAGRDVKRATELEIKSIEAARTQLEQEQKTIHDTLGGMDGKGYIGPRPPRLPVAERSMDVAAFTLAALPMLGAHVDEHSPGVFVANEKSSREYVIFDKERAIEGRTTLYSAATPAFQRLVKRVIASGYHQVSDKDVSATAKLEELAREWAKDVGATVEAVQPQRVSRRYSGKALLRVRATVAHDSYERLVSCDCESKDHTRAGKKDLIAPIANTVDDLAQFGINKDALIEAGERDTAIAEFSRFYLERRELELASADGDERKRRKLADDFTPRLDMTLVGLEGEVSRDVDVAVQYGFPGAPPYETELTLRPSTGEVLRGPARDLCTKTGRMVPKDALARCAITSGFALRHLLVKSEVSGRMALPEFTTTCSLSGKRVLTDEVEGSSVTGKTVAATLLKASAVSGKRAEPEHFDVCAFSGVDALRSELAASELSGKQYRLDQGQRSTVSGKSGHLSEFTQCHLTNDPIARVEAEMCEITNKAVKPGVLQVCDETGKRVLPSELGKCSESGVRSLNSLLVTSSVSQQPILSRIALRASSGEWCAPREAMECFWSGRRSHPLDLRICSLTGLPIHIEFATPGQPRLKPLSEMLDGVRRSADESGVWQDIALRLGSALNVRKLKVEAAVLSPAKQHLATCSEVRTLLGARVRQAGAIYDIGDHSIVGRIAEGKRANNQWRMQGSSGGRI